MLLLNVAEDLVLFSQKRSGERRYHSGFPDTRLNSGLEHFNETILTLRVLFHTFGCKANQYDTERMRQELEAWGAKTTTERPEADVFVVNTCTVTNQADADARRFIRRLQREVHLHR